MHSHSLTLVSPQDYISTHQIRYGIHPTPFSRCLLSMFDRKICGLHFITKNDESTLVAEMQSIWHLADFVEDGAFTKSYVEKLFQRDGPPFSLVVKGTPFQTKVWQSLLSIPVGTLSHYEGVAKNAGHPKATRAAAHAVATNPISFLIPCHRVIYKSGEIGKYRWGADCKKKILEWEGSLETCALARNFSFFHTGNQLKQKESVS